MSSESKHGFTLLELLVVITVIAILASLVSPMVFRNIGDAKQTSARAQIEAIGVALEQYRLDNERYPSSEQGLVALRRAPDGATAPNWRGPYLRKDVPLDPWTRPYTYRAPGAVNADAYDLLSLGRDGREGGRDDDADVLSWSQ